MTFRNSGNPELNGHEQRQRENDPQAPYHSSIEKGFRRNLINMTSMEKANDVSIALATWAHSPHFKDYAATGVYQSGFRENNDVVKEVAARYGAYLFDFAALMPQDRKYWSDGRHVNEAGALLKAELFADFIRASGALDKTGTDMPADEGR